MIYNSTHRNDVGKIIRKLTEGYENEGIIIGGDFNIRIGELRGEEEEGGIARKSKDKTIENGGRRLIEIMQERGFNVLNRKTREDWEGEYACIGARGNTVIDYIFVNEKIKEKVIEFRFAERVDSDHMPICLELEAEEEGRGSGKGKKEEIEEKKVICWDEEAKKT